MTPSRATELLYNDIIPVEIVRNEHDQLRSVLQRYAETIELVDLLARLAGRPDGIGQIADGLAFGNAETADALALRWQEMPPERIVADCVTGVPVQHGRLARELHGPRFLTPPLPNLYFMRDASFVVHGHAFKSEMAGEVRRAESVLVALALGEMGIPVRRLESPVGSIEGGDVLVYSEDIIVIGVGPRTTADAVDALLAALAADRHSVLTALAVLLPDERATIHLDMILTILEPNRVLAYTPLYEGAHAAPVYKIEVPPGGRSRDRWRIEAHESLRSGFTSCGVELDRIPCGGTDPIVRDREQWFSGCNSVALAPGQVVVFGSNRATLSALADADYQICTPDMTGVPDSGARVAWALDGLELARGGGGPRCMTLPVDRVEES